MKVDSHQNELAIELLLLLCRSERSHCDIPSLLPYDPDEIHTALSSLSKNWILTSSPASVSLTIIGMVLARKIVAVLDTIHKHRDNLSGSRNTRCSGHWTDDANMRSAARHEILGLCPWLVISPDWADSCSIIIDPPDGDVRVESLHLKTPDRETCRAAVTGLYRTMIVVHRFGEFLMVHAIDLLPQAFLDRIGDLCQARLVCNMPIDFQQNVDFFIDIIRNAHHFHGVSSIATPGIAIELAKKALKGTEIELVITPDLAAELLKPPYRTIAVKIQTLCNLRFRIVQVPIAVGLTVTDRHLSVGFFTRERRVYDRIYDLVSSSPESCAWGEDLFRYYHDHSVPVENPLSEVGST